MSLNKNSVYCVMPQTSEPPDTCKSGGPKLPGILQFSLFKIIQETNTNKPISSLDVEGPCEGSVFSKPKNIGPNDYCSVIKGKD